MLRERMITKGYVEKWWKSLLSLPLVLSSRVISSLFPFLLLCTKNTNSNWVFVYQFYIWINNQLKLSILFHSQFWEPLHWCFHIDLITSSSTMVILVFVGNYDAYFWVLCIEKYFKVREIPETEKMSLAATAMRGCTLKWWRWWSPLHPDVS